MAGHSIHTDVIVVGAGSAGSVLAERLSEDSAYRVTVVEAGCGPSDPGVRSLIDNGLELPIGPTSPLVQRYQTMLTRDPERSVGIVRGTTVGGSGAINGGYFCRALPSDFATPTLPGWSWPEINAHYCAIEMDLDHCAAGGAGPIRIRRVSEFEGFTREFVAAAGAAGFRWLPDLNAVPIGLNEPPGVGAVPLNIVEGVRIGPGSAFLEASLNRPNLTVLTHTRALRLKMAGARAIGVDAVGRDGAMELLADRIVLSAGAIESAHLLMLSGIGPADTLSCAGIDVGVDLPVGLRFWDHPEWVMSTNWTATESHPALEVVLVSAGVEIRPYTRGFMSLTGVKFEDHADRPHVGVALMHPAARGRISVVSADPMVPPRVEHRYDSEPGDVMALRNGCELVMEIVGGATELGSPVWSTSQHLCGTAPMGVDGDDSVVDPSCRVHGVEGLWVVDGSVLPWTTSRGPHATIAMVAHRASEFVCQ